MADSLTSLSLLTLAQVHRGDIVRQINRSVQLLKMIPITRGSGKNVAWPVEKDGALAESYSEGADAVNFGGDVQAQAILTWGLYRANPHATSLALDSAASSYDPDGNKQFWARTLVNHSAALAEKINGECFTGAGTTGLICGLDEAIGKDDNIYAGIDRVAAGNEYWKPTVTDPGVATAPTFALLRGDVKDIYLKCGRNPDVAMCDPAVFNKIGSLFDATRRNVEMVNTARGGVKLDMGFQALELDGMFFLKDRQATANRIYYLQTDLMELVVLPSADQRMLEQVAAMQVQANDGFGTVPMSFHYEMLAKTGASEKAQILSNSQLIVRRPNAFGVRKNVSSS